MSELVSFPGLGLNFEISRVAFSIGNYNIYWYGITFALGFLAGMWYFHCRARRLGVHPYDGLDILLWAVVGGMVGARLYFVAFQWDMYKDNLLKIFAFREGGIAIYGGVIGSVLTGWIVCKIKKARFLPVLDGGLTGLLLAQAIGRWGNFFNQEAFGCNTTLPWGMTSNTVSRYLFNMADSLAAQGVMVDPTVPVHPTFFYEFCWNLLGFLILAFLVTPRRKYDGQVSLCYMAWYGLGRFFIEGLRTDSLMWGPFRVSQVLALALCAGSLLILAVMELRRRKDPAAFVLYVDTDESRERMAKVDAELDKEKNKGGDASADGEAQEENSEVSGEDDDLVEASEDGEESPVESPAEVALDGDAPAEATESPEEIPAGDEPQAAIPAEAGTEDAPAETEEAPEGTEPQPDKENPQP